jgi:NAD+ synthase
METEMNVGELAERLVLWIMEKVSSGRRKGVVLGMSGGVDSSVVAVLCQRAFPQSTLGVLMPCYSSQEDEQHALAVASKFSIPTRTVVLDSVFDTLLKVLPDDAADPPASRLPKANLKVRLRMLTLYYFANRLEYMVVGSSNRSELAVGYFTKYGDGGVDIMPLGNLVKAQVKELASFLGIPQEIIDKTPSAGLWPGQTDEGEMGFSYDELDRYLVTDEASDKLKKKIESMMTASDHKRHPPPFPAF